MGIVLIVPTAILIALFIWLMMTIIDGGDEAGGILSLMIIVIVFGYGLIGGLVSVKTQESILMPDEIAKTEYTLFVKCEGQTINSTEAKFVNVSNDLIRVLKTDKINSYGSIVSSSYQLYINDGG